MPENYYDSDRGIAEYLMLHYGGYENRLPEALRIGLEFPARCVWDCLDPSRLPKNARALDLGCAVGRSTFELARHCAEVIGIDYSKRFAEVATELRNKGAKDFQYTEEGELTRPVRAVVPVDIARERATFEQGDAMQLRENLGEFDVVLMANLIDRLSDPAKCLAQLPALISKSGQLIITSPYTWLPEYTRRENWLGGFIQDKKPVTTFETLQKILGTNFELATRKTLTFVIREHARKYQLGFPEATVWIRK